MIGRFSPTTPDAHALPERAPLADHDATERLGTEDMAALHAEQLLNAARLDQRRAAAAMQASRPGVCSNCGDPCLPAAVYCDDDCRGDHELRLRTLRRRGAAG